MSAETWRRAVVSPDGTHHRLDGAPLYAARFLEVLKYHAPGLAPARDATGMYHIDAAAKPAYGRRFRRVFGFYDGVAAVDGGDGWFHIYPDGAAAYTPRWHWVGNVQGGRCPVRDADGRYAHIRRDGTAVSAARWRYAGDFRDGVAVVQAEDGRSAHVDTEGALLNGRWFVDLDVFHKGFARARDERGWMHVDVRGVPAYTRRFAMVEPFYNGQARVERFDGAREVIDERGDPLVELSAARTDPFHAASAELVSFWRCEAVFAAVRAGIFDRLPLDAAPAPEARLLDALAELGLVERSGSGWSATAAGAHLRADHPRSLAAAARYWESEGRRAWVQLPAALTVPGWIPADPFAAAAADPAQVWALQAALRPYALHDYAEIATVVDCTHQRVIDAAGGSGALAFALLRARPDLTGVVFDRPEVAAMGAVPDDLRGRVTWLSGDVFGPWPATADAILLARVLHDWPDDAAVEILRHARESLAPGGRLYVVELVRDPAGVRGGLLSLHLLLSTGGRERTCAEFEGLFLRAGLRLVEVRRLPSVSDVLVVAAA